MSEQRNTESARERFPDRLVARIAKSQLGLVTRSQAIAAGLSSDQIAHRLKLNHLQLVSRNVYRLSGAPITFEQRLLAAQLSIGQDAVVSHRPAGVFWGLIPSTDLVELSLIVDRRLRCPSEWVLHRSKSLTEADLVKRLPFVITEPHRTMIDLAQVLDKGTLEEALERGLSIGLIRVPRLTFKIRTVGTQGRRNISNLLDLVDERSVAGRTTESKLEVMFLRILKKARLPLPIPQYWITLGDGKRIRVDFAYPDRRIAIECDSVAYHGIRTALRTDKRRDRELIRLGWKPVRFMSDDLFSNETEVAEVMRALLEE